MRDNKRPKTIIMLYGRGSICDIRKASLVEQLMSIGGSKQFPSWTLAFIYN